MSILFFYNWVLDGGRAGFCLVDDREQKTSKEEDQFFVHMIDEPSISFYHNWQALIDI